MRSTNRLLLLLLLLLRLQVRAHSLTTSHISKKTLSQSIDALDGMNTFTSLNKTRHISTKRKPIVFFSITLIAAPKFPPNMATGFSNTCSMLAFKSYPLSRTHSDTLHSNIISTCLKNVPTSASCNCDKHWLILITLSKQYQHAFTSDVTIQPSFFRIPSVKFQDVLRDFSASGWILDFFRAQKWKHQISGLFGIFRNQWECRDYFWHTVSSGYHGKCVVKSCYCCFCRDSVYNKKIGKTAETSTSLLAWSWKSCENSSTCCSLPALAASINTSSGMLVSRNKSLTWSITARCSCNTHTAYCIWQQQLKSQKVAV